MNSQLRKQHGFTLFEIMLSISIFCMLLASVFSFYQFQQKLLQKEIVTQDIRQHGRTALNRTTQLLQYSDSLLIESDLVSMINGQELVPLIDYSGYTKRAEINFMKDLEGNGQLVNSKGEIIADHIREYSIELKDNLILIHIIVSRNGKEVKLDKKMYLNKL